jgi:hypothetical protein
MLTNQRSACTPRDVRRWDRVRTRPDVRDRAGRHIQIALAIYLLPVLVVVLAIGGLGILVLEVRRFLTIPVRGPVPSNRASGELANAEPLMPVSRVRSEAGGMETLKGGRL